jgi:hypothetical protein
MYDMLSTIAYLPNDRLALAVEGRQDNLRRSQLVEFAARLSVPERAVVRMLDRICEVAPSWIERVGEIGFPERVSERLRREISKRRNRLAT